MDKRYYYDCIIKASYMKKYFDMEFYTEDGDHLTPDGEMNGALSPRNGYHIYIRESSLPLLQPMEGDLVHIVRGFCSYYKNVVSTATVGGRAVTGIWSDGEYWDITIKAPLHDWQIIQRNGIPFMWPEVDNG